MVDLPAGTHPTDLNEDGNTDGADLASLLGAWGTDRFDLDGNGLTDGADLAYMLGSWGSHESWIEAVTWEQTTHNPFAASSGCDELGLIAYLAFSAASWHNEGNPEAMILDGAEVLQTCGEIEPLDLDDSVSIELVNTGDFMRSTPEGAGYLRVDDVPIFSAIAEDSYGNQLPVELTASWSDEADQRYIPGAPIGRSGFHWIRGISTSPSGATGFVSKQIVVLSYDLVDVSAVVTDVTFSGNQSGETEIEAFVELRSEEVNMFDVNVLTPNLWFAYADGESGSEEEFVRMPIVGVDDANNQSLALDNVDARIDELGVMHMRFKGVVPTPEALYYVVTGEGLGFPGSFAFKTMAEEQQGDGSGGLAGIDEPEGGNVWDDNWLPANGEPDGCKIVLNPGWKMQDNEVIEYGFDQMDPAGDVIDDYCPFGNSSWYMDHSAEGMALNARGHAMSRAAPVEWKDGTADSSWPRDTDPGASERGVYGERWEFHTSCPEGCNPVVSTYVTGKQFFTAEILATPLGHGGASSMCGGVLRVDAGIKSCSAVNGAAVAAGRNVTIGGGVNVDPTGVGVGVNGSTTIPWIEERSDASQLVLDCSVPNETYIPNMFYPVGAFATHHIEVYANGECASDLYSAFLWTVGLPLTSFDWGIAQANAKSSAPTYAIEISVESHADCEGDYEPMHP